jgi:5-methylcytosine-specific restriction endonuclease McrA
MLKTQRLALDHRTPIALGGQTTLSNVRIVHHRCNHRAGSQLGGNLRRWSR